MAAGKFHGVIRPIDADRLARHLDADAGADRGEDVARQAQGLAGEEAEDLAGAHHLADALRQGLALFARQDGPELVLAGQDLVGDLLQGVVPLLRGRAGPARRGRLCGGDGALGIGLGRARKFTDHVARVGGVLVRRHVGGTHPFAGDEVLGMDGHGVSPGGAVLGRFVGGVVLLKTGSKVNGGSSMAGARAVMLRTAQRRSPCKKPSSASAIPTLMARRPWSISTIRGGSAGTHAGPC